MKSTLISYKVNNWKLFLQNDPEPVKEIIDNPSLFFEENFSKKDFELFNLIIYAFNKYNQVYISQSTLARWVGCSREHANRILSRLKDWGLISSYYRYKKSCFYKLSSFFSDFYVRKSLSKLFKSFSFLTVIWLNSPLYASFAKKITLLNICNIKKVDRTTICYFNCCQVLCACTYARVREENGAQKNGEKNLKHEVLNRLSEKLGLTRDDLDRLKNYDDDILLKAEDILKKRTPANPAGYLFGICKQEQSRKDQTEAKKTYKKFEPKPISVPIRKPIDPSKSVFGRTADELKVTDNRFAYRNSQRVMGRYVNQAEQPVVDESAVVEVVSEKEQVRRNSWKMTAQEAQGLYQRGMDNLKYADQKTKDFFHEIFMKNIKAHVHE